MKQPFKIILLLVLLLPYFCETRLVSDLSQLELAIENKPELKSTTNVVPSVRKLLQTIEIEEEPVLSSEEIKADIEERRTATGGIVNSIMIVLTVIAFIGNGLFLVYVFWLSK